MSDPYDTASRRYGFDKVLADRNRVMRLVFHVYCAYWYLYGRPVEEGDAVGVIQQVMMRLPEVTRFRLEADVSKEVSRSVLSSFAQEMYRQGIRDLLEQGYLR